MIYWRVGWVLAILQALCVAFMSGLIWTPLTSFEVVDAALLWKFALFTANILFLVLPVVALAGMLRRNRMGFIAMAAFPVPAWVFGTMPLPFSSALLPFTVSTNSWIITIVNTVAVAIGVVLYLKSGKAREAAASVQS